MAKKRQSEYEKLIFEMFYNHAYQTAYFIVRDAHMAQDIVQESFIKIFKKIHTVKDGDKLKAWIGTVTTRTAIDFIRKSKKSIDLLADDVYIDKETIQELNNQPTVEAIVESKLVKELLQQKLSELKPEYKEVLLLKYEHDLKEQEIADALEISLSAVKSRIYRGKQRLKEILIRTEDFKDGGRIL
ncbi:RNA polymerase sigma factor [Bacillaceae bacterium S4-13-58]